MNSGRSVVMVVVACAALAAWAGGAEGASPGRRAAQPNRVAAPARVQTLDIDRRIDVNNVNMYVTNYGAFGYDLGGNYNGGFFFPNHTSKTAIYAAGLWMGAKVGTGTDYRIAAAEYDQEYRPGRILPGGALDPPGDPRLVVYKVLPWKGSPADTGHLDNPSANFDVGEDPLLHHSWSEYVNGAKPFGAPTRIYTLPAPGGGTVNVEGPDVLGDMMLWCIYNDGDAASHTNEAGSTAPLGVQIEQTTWAYDRPGALGNTIFVKYKVKNAGSNTLDSLSVSQWCDADLGGFTDDLVGCDTLPDLNGHHRSLGFCYNGRNTDDVYGDVPPALGFDFLKGPLGAAGDTLGLTSFAKYINGTDPLSGIETWYYMNGFNGNGTPIVDPYGKTTKFMVAGDPLLPTSDSWLDSNPADRRFFMTSGPITMVPGDSQEVIVAIMAAQCGDRLSSIKALRFADDAAQATYDRAFQVPTVPPAPQVTASADHGQVRLDWDTGAQTATLEPGYTFEGYHVFQGATIAGPWKLVAVWDSVNAIREVYDQRFDEANCDIVLAAKSAFGNDNGLRDYYVTTQDAVGGTTLKDGTDYYFGVTSYAVNLAATVNRVSESPLKSVKVTPRRATSAVTASMVRAVPNPYYAHSAYEQTQFNRRIRFVNVPAQCTIRIYNLAGQLVQTLEKNDASTSVLEWNLHTRNDLPVGSGVYVYHVQAQGSGEAVGRLAIFVEKERLNNY